ncbi:MAG: ABC transporter substrate-binding protein [Rhizobiales bacterium]|nr:ABC transporter substrate-binding protein [Hyphomicrobiales bacterium]
MKTHRYLSLVPIASLLAIAVPAHAEDILVGEAIAKSGWMEPYDYSARMADLAIEDINASGGLLGRQIKTSVIDTKTDPAESAQAGATLVSEGADLVIVSCDYDQGAPAALAAVGAGKLAISLCAGDPKMGVQGIGKLAFTAATAGQTQGATNAAWAHDTKGLRSAYILVDTNIEYSKSVCKGFEWQWKQYADSKLLGSDTFKNDDPSIATQISRIKELPEKPAAIALCSFMPGAASALRQLRAAGIDQPVFMPTGSDGTYWFASVPDISDVYLPAAVLAGGGDPNPEVNKLIDRYKEKYGDVPATSYVLSGYALIQMWADAVKQAGTTDGDKVADALESFKDHPTVLGPISFSPQLHIQNKARFLMLGVKDGKYEQFGYVTSPDVPAEVLFAQ